MPAVALVAVAAIAAGGAAASAAAKRRAADKAAKYQKEGIDKQNKILDGKLGPLTLNELARKADEARAQNRIALQEKIDPELAKLRVAGKEKMLKEGSIDEADKQSTKAANVLFNETVAQDPKMEALKNSIIDRAQSEIDAGATLPPEFQAELVRSGLNTGSQAGIAINKNSIGGGVAKALGLGAIQLQAQRDQAAQSLAGTAQNLINARVSVLSSVFPKLRDLETQRQMDAARNFQLADQALPESGLTGREQVNIEMAKQNKRMSLLQQKQNIKAQQQINKGEYTGAMIGAGTKFATSVAGGFSPGGAFNKGGGITESVMGSEAPAGTQWYGGKANAPNDFGTGINWG